MAENTSPFVSPIRCLRRLLVLGALLVVVTKKATVVAFEMPENTLRISHMAAHLSALSYENPQDFASEGDLFAHADFDRIHFFNDEPHQAVFAIKEGRCFLAFRGTTSTASDWQQNLNIATTEFHRSNNKAESSCIVRAGFAEFDFLFDNDQIQDVFSCLDECPDPDDCLVLTGHSKGGAAATILSIWLADYSPTLVTFGAPESVQSNCEHIPSDRTYRYVNTVAPTSGGLRFDGVPFLPTFVQGLGHFGHFLLLGPRESQVVYGGFDDDYDGGYGFPFVDVGAAHQMRYRNGTAPYSYEGRLMPYSNITILDGFPTGSPCAPVDGLCAAGTVCVRGVCAKEQNIEAVEESLPPLQQVATTKESENMQGDFASASISMKLHGIVLAGGVSAVVLLFA